MLPNRAPSREDPQGKRWVTSPGGIAVLYVIIVMLAIMGIAPRALPVIMLDLVSALLILIPPALAGLWLIPLLGLSRAPLRWHLVIGSVLGIGSFCLMVFLGGLLGRLERPLWLGFLILLAALGIVRLRHLIAAHHAKPTSSDTGATHPTLRLLWLTTIPFAVAGLLAASNPPGVIWSEEGMGYDVLEYHLQMPKEYATAGEIAYAPHNVYANFPSQVEMLYLINMVVRRDAIESGTTANSIHLLLGVLAVATAWCVGSHFSGRAGLFAGVLLGTVGWLPYLAGLAYVELGMLAYGLLAVGALLRALCDLPQTAHDSDARVAQQREVRSWLLVSGIASGLACGCKYTAVPMIALPILLCCGLVGRDVKTRLRSIALVGIATVATCAPWLLKNVLMTGNPVFPLAYQVFQTYPEGWDATTAARWERGHSFVSQATPRVPNSDRDDGPTPESAPFVERVMGFWNYVVADHYQRFGPVILVLPLITLVLMRRRPRGSPFVIALVLMLVVPWCVWLFATHLYARFAVPLLIPLTLIGGVTLASFSSRAGLLFAGSAIAMGAIWNVIPLIRLHADESYPGLPASVIYEGTIPSFAYYGVVNELIGGRVLAIGEARAFYFRRNVDYVTVFNVNPFLEVLEKETQSEPVVGWLVDNGYAHLLVNWLEVDRLRRTYGFSSAITPQRFNRLIESGLELVWESTDEGIGKGRVQLFAVPRVR